jgi:predicted  nucleic acid-binding Zn-ribbon protein
MTPEAISGFMKEISEKEKARARLSGWKRFITKGPSLADRQLFFYLLSRRYLSATLKSEPIDARYRGSFLPVLEMNSFYAKKWHTSFTNADRLRTVNHQKREETENRRKEIQALKESLEATKIKIEATKKQVLAAQGWLVVAEFNLEFAKGFLGERLRLIKCATLMAIESVLKFPIQVVYKELTNFLTKMGKAVELPDFKVVSYRLQRKFRKEDEEISKLRQAIITLSEEVIVMGAKVMQKSETLSADYDQLMKTRLAESHERVAKSKKELRSDYISAIHRVEKRAAELLRWESEVRGLSKVHRRHHPRTEGDIEWLWNALFQETAKGGVSHLLVQSAIIRAILSQSQFAGSIFRRVESERRSLAIRACEDQAQELVRWEQTAEELSQSPTFDRFQARLNISSRWCNIFGRAYDRGYFDLAERSVVVQEALSRSSMANSIFKTQQSEPNPPLSLETASGFESRQSLHS